MFESLSQSLSHIFSKITGCGSIDQTTIDDTLGHVVDALLQSDVPYDVAYAFRDQLRDKLSQESLTKGVTPDEQLMHVVHTQVAQFLGGHEEDASVPHTSVIMMMGLQGSGKTTSVVKLAREMQHHQSSRVLVGSIDFARPAAVEQLRVYAQQAGVDTYQATAEDPVAAAQEIVQYSRENGYDSTIIDTAGRLHVADDMIHELQQVQKAIKPSYRILVLDAMTGQTSLEVARSFTSTIGFEAGILTKMDSDTRGGAAFAFRYAIGKPIIYCGSGEKVDDFEAFKPDRIARRMLDMGDLLTLSEKAQEKIQAQEAEQSYNRMQRGEMTLEDFAQQLQMMQRLGSLSSIMQYMPGASSMRMSDETMAQAEQELNQFRVIMNSMTSKERTRPKIINRSRKERIARGAGVSVKSVTHLLDRFQQTQRMMKMMKNMGGLQQLFQ